MDAMKRKTRSRKNLPSCDCLPKLLHPKSRNWAVRSHPPKCALAAASWPDAVGEKPAAQPELTAYSPAESPLH
jgi:hypothetical protein